MMAICLKVFVPDGAAYEKVEALSAWLSDDVASPLLYKNDSAQAGPWQKTISFDQAGFHLLDKDF